MQNLLRNRVLQFEPPSQQLHGMHLEFPLPHVVVVAVAALEIAEHGVPLVGKVPPDLVHAPRVQADGRQ